jgi:type IV pilus assembly protein PilZ
MLSLNIKEKSAWYAVFMPHLRDGGSVIPTGCLYKLGDEVYMLQSLMNDPANMPVAGRVAGITPKDAHGSKQQGIGVEFSADEAGALARRKIENLLGNALGSTRQTHTL